MAMPHRKQRASRAVAGNARAERSAARAAMLREFENEARAYVDRTRHRDRVYPDDACEAVKQITSTPETARRYLEELGIIDETGKLRAEYRPG